MSKARLSKKCYEFSTKRIAHPTFKQIQKVVRKTHKYTGVQPKIVLITSPSHCGKSTALEYYCETYNEQFNASSDEFHFEPVLYIELDSDITVAGLLVLILKALGVTRARATDRVSDLLGHVIEKLKLYKIELVILDEVQHIVPETGPRRTQKLADHIKSISNKTKIPFILSGLPPAKKLFTLAQLSLSKRDEPVHPDDTEGMQLANRSRTGIDIKPYLYDTAPDSDWVNLIDSYINIFKLIEVPIVNLHSDELPLRLWLATFGIIGRLKYIFQEAIELFEDEDTNHKMVGCTILAEAYDDVSAEWRKFSSEPKLNPFELDEKQLNRWLAKELTG